VSAADVANWPHENTSSTTRAARISKSQRIRTERANFPLSEANLSETCAQKRRIGRSAGAQSTKINPAFTFFHAKNMYMYFIAQRYFRLCVLEGKRAKIPRNEIFLKVRIFSIGAAVRVELFMTHSRTACTNGNI